MARVRIEHNGVGTLGEQERARARARACAVAQAHDDGHALSRGREFDRRQDLVLESAAILRNEYEALALPRLEPVLHRDPSFDKRDLVWRVRVIRHLSRVGIGIEQHRVLVRSDLKTQLICNKTPTPHESSYDKGLVVGMQLLATEFNSWLESQGHVGDYPTMSNPINVCNINQGLLVPAKQSALNNVDSHAESNPLCDNYALVEPGLQAIGDSVTAVLRY